VALIKAVIFDLGGVLFSDGSTRFIQFLARTFGIDPELSNQAINGRVSELYREGKISRDQFWLEAKHLLHLDETAARLEREWIEAYELNEEVKCIISSLSRRCRVFYLSDNVKERVEALETKCHFLDLFDGGVFSYEVGIKKPNPLIYRLVLERAGVEAHESIFVDDKPRALLPAVSLGMRTVLFRGSPSLRASLDEFRVL
jgi:HAD superfamily hydrolase (TIGR01509 family)